MAYVSNNSDEESPTVLIVESNVMSIQRLTSIFKIKDFNIEICQDGDKAVDEYIRLDPELVVISLDIPTLDGHLTALEMREHGGDARIVFVAPRRLAMLQQMQNSPQELSLGSKNLLLRQYWMKNGRQFSDLFRKHPASKTWMNYIQLTE